MLETKFKRFTNRTGYSACLLDVHLLLRAEKQIEKRFYPWKNYLYSTNATFCVTRGICHQYSNVHISDQT